MILLDTHIWIWWVHDDARLSLQQKDFLQRNENNSLSVSVVSCWEVAKLVEIKKIELPFSINEWMDKALVESNIQLIDLTLPIVIESTQLPGEFHRDPADQWIVATARIHDCVLVTSDSKILNYSHVKTFS